MLYFFDLVGTCVFAISGTNMASDKKLDIFGAAVIGFITAIGGGTFRDMMLGNTPVTWIQDVNYFYSILFGITITFFFKSKITKIRKAIFLFDTIGIALFTIFGIQKALSFEIAYPIALLFGVISAVFGGILRDIICNEIPLIFREEIYATACIIGGSIFLGLHYFNINESYNYIITSLIIILIRILAVRYHWRLPVY